MLSRRIDAFRAGGAHGRSVPGRDPAQHHPGRGDVRGDHPYVQSGSPPAGCEVCGRVVRGGSRPRTGLRVEAHFEGRVPGHGQRCGRVRVRRGDPRARSSARSGSPRCRIRSPAPRTSPECWTGSPGSYMFPGRLRDGRSGGVRRRIIRLAPRSTTACLGDGAAMLAELAVRRLARSFGVTAWGARPVRRLVPDPGGSVAVARCGRFGGWCRIRADPLRSLGRVRHHPKYGAR